MFTPMYKTIGSITFLAVAFFFVTSSCATTLTIEAVGNGTPEQVEWLRQRLDLAIGTPVIIDPNTGVVTVTDGGNELAKYLREIANSPENVLIGVDFADPGVVFGSWYKDNTNKHQTLDVADLMRLPMGDTNTIGPTQASVIFHEIAQMYISLSEGKEYNDAHRGATDIENMVHETLGNRGRRVSPNSTIFEDSQNPGTFKSFTDYSADGVDWVIEGFIANQGTLSETSWRLDWLGPVDLIVPRTDLQWLGYIARPVPEPSALTLFFAGLIALATILRKPFKTSACPLIIQTHSTHRVSA